MERVPVGIIIYYYLLLSIFIQLFYIGNKNIPLTDIVLEKITIHANPLAR
jgi:hypothetical protein